MPARSLDAETASSCRPSSPSPFFASDDGRSGRVPRSWGIRLIYRGQRVPRTELRCLGGRRRWRMAGCCREGRGDLGVGVWVVSSLESLPDDELQAEREMLEHARRCLAAMRRRTRSLRAVAADPYAVESVEWRLRQRVASLTDDGRTGLFFGRLDYDASADPPEARFYVGRRHVSDAKGDPVVIDWRAGLAHPFYRASPTHRYGVRARRRFGYRGGTLTSIQDELLDLLDEAEALAVADRVLVAEIERPRIGPMRDIVATIQPEQADLIRAPLAETIC